MRARHLVILASMLPSPALAGVVINELLPNPAGVDLGKEWIEIVNTGPVDVDITGWEIEAGTASFSSRHVFAALVLAPGDRIVVGELSVVGADILTPALDMGNASASGDAVRLVDALGNPVDTVVYGPNNNDAFVDDTGGVAVSLAATPGDNDSLARIPDGVDTDAAGADFDVVILPTMGVTNDVGGGIDTGDTSLPGIDTGAPPPACDLTGIVINELLPDPTGADADQEWVELHNNLGRDVDLSGWVIEAGPSSYSTSGVLPAGTIIPANGWIVVGQSALVPDADVAAPGFVLGNASTSSDAVRLVNCDGGIVDTVVYGTPNTDLWEDDDGLVAASLAPKPGEAESIARLPDGTDTDQSGADFAVLTTPSPGALNEVPVPVCSMDVVLINELVSDPAGADTGLEWVELHNPGAVDVDVSGWTIESGPSSFSTEGVLPAGSVIPAGGWLVVGQSALPDIDVVAAGFSLGNATTSSDAVRLLDPGACVADTVVYGTPNTDAWLDDDGLVAASLAPKPAEDESIGRFPDGTDTDQSGLDFAGFATPTPGAGNTQGGGGPIGGACDDAVLGAAIVINELVSDPSGTDDGNEWVELYNPGATSVDVSGWVIASGTSSFSGSGTLPEGTMILPGEFLVVGQAAVADIDIVAPGFSLGNASTSSDGVRVEDCNGTPVDTVIYGDPNTDLWIDDTGAVATSLAPAATSPSSLARVTDGVDTDASAVDFEVAVAPTPGTSNDVAPPDCGGAGSGLKINEFIYDPDGSDNGLEWIELYNAGGASIDLSGWAIQKATSSFADAFVFPDGTTLAPGALLLVGETLVPGIAFEATLGLGNASSSADGVRVVDCAGLPVDTVIYGDENTDGLVDDSGQPATSLAPTTGSGASLQRVSDGYDTDLSAVDFAVQEIPSPGESNAEVEPVVCTPSAGDVVLNELIPNPAGSDTGAEWVELYNRGSSPVDVSGWGIDLATSSWGDPDVVLPGGTIIEAGGWLVVGGSLAPEVDVVGDVSIGNASSSADGVQLTDCAGAVVDTVVYGTANPDNLLDDAGGVVPSPVPGEAGSLARNEDGVDTDSPDDWVIRGLPSPGASNFFEAPDGGDDEDDASKGCGCGGGTDAPGQGLTDMNGCSTSTVPVRGMALALLALFIRRRR